MAEPKGIVANPWADRAFVERYEADVAAEERGEIDEGLTVHGTVYRAIIGGTDVEIIYRLLATGSPRLLEVR